MQVAHSGCVGLWRRTQGRTKHTKLFSNVTLFNTSAKLSIIFETSKRLGDFLWQKAGKEGGREAEMGQNRDINRALNVL